MKIVLLLSGGLDSAVLLWHLVREQHEVRCLSVCYGQRHIREIDAAKQLAHKGGAVIHKVADLNQLSFLFRGSSQTSREIAVPEGHYADESMRQTVVPNRNMVMLSLAAAWAVSSDSEAIAYAAHAGDHAIYPDCRQDFVDAMRAALDLCDYKTIALLTPFVDAKMEKVDIVRRGHRLGVPFGLTWSCYKGGQVHCGKCGTCYERRESFKLANVPDPTEYE